MAIKRVSIVVCDKHRGDVEAAGTLEIAIDGQHRRLDLCAAHLAEARQALRPWLRAVARERSGRAAATRTPSNTSTSRREAAALRAWAAANGYELPGRGRIPAAVHDAYRAAFK